MKKGELKIRDHWSFLLIQRALTRVRCQMFRTVPKHKCTSWPRPALVPTVSASCRKMRHTLLYVITRWCSCATAAQWKATQRTHLYRLCGCWLVLFIDSRHRWCKWCKCLQREMVYKSYPCCISTYCCIILSNRAGARWSVTCSGTAQSAHTGQTDWISGVKCGSAPLVSDRSSCLTLHRILLLQTKQGCHYT